MQRLDVHPVATTLGLDVAKMVQQFQRTVQALCAQAEEAETFLGNSRIVEDKRHTVPTL